MVFKKMMVCLLCGVTMIIYSQPLRSPFDYAISQNAHHVLRQALISQLQLKGILVFQKTTVAFVSNQQQEALIKQGDLVGVQAAKVIEIKKNQVVLQEKVGDQIKRWMISFEEN